MSEQSFRTSLTPAAFFHPDDCSLRMSQATLLSEAPPLLERLPDWGMTADGAVYPLPKPRHHTYDADGFSSPTFPTPVVNDMGRGKSVEAWDSWTAEMKAKHGNGNGHGKSLSIEVQRLLPTPTAQDGANNAGPSQWNRNSDPLNVVAVKLSGSSSPLPLSDGNEPSDDQHPHPPTTGNCPADSSNG